MVAGLSRYGMLESRAAQPSRLAASSHDVHRNGRGSSAAISGRLGDLVAGENLPIVRVWATPSNQRILNLQNTRFSIVMQISLAIASSWTYEEIQLDVKLGLAHTVNRPVKSNSPDMHG